MKTTATEISKKPETREYPLLITDGKCVVFAENDNEGTVLHDWKSGEFEFGMFIDKSAGFFDSWNKYEGVVTLENN